MLYPCLSVVLSISVFPGYFVSCLWIDIRNPWWMSTASASGCTKLETGFRYSHDRHLKAALDGRGHEWYLLEYLPICGRTSESASKRNIQLRFNNRQHILFANLSRWVTLINMLGLPRILPLAKSKWPIQKHAVCCHRSSMWQNEFNHLHSDIKNPSH